MRRISEPELMDTEEQAHAYAFADFEEPHSLAVEILRERHGELPDGGIALDLGCGPADVSIRFAHTFPNWRVHGIDGSGTMLRHGRDAVARIGFAGRIELFEARLPQDPAPLDSYQFILSSSVLHHFDDPATLWRSLHHWGPCGTPVFIFDLLRPRTEQEAEELIRQHIAGEPEVLQQDFRNSLFAAYSLDEVRQQLATFELSHLRVEQVSDRHLITWGRV